MNKEQRRKTHHEINGLTHEQVAAIVRHTFPRVKAEHVDGLAKKIIAGAHKMISPRKTQRGR